MNLDTVELAGNTNTSTALHLHVAGTQMVHRGSGRSSAFSIIELIVLLGVLMVLLGLFLPTLASMRESGRMTRSMTSLQQNVQLLSHYSTDYRELYPIASPRLNLAVLYWGEALVTAGYVNHVRVLDPDGYRHWDSVSYALSHCMLHDPSLMQPGRTVPIEHARTSPIRQSQVVFPSAKGLMYQWRIATSKGEAWWCCTDKRPKLPVAMADGSVALAVWTDFRLYHDGLIENWVGYPVASTWGGVRAADR